MERLSSLGGTVQLTAFLVILFVVQNLFFNSWVGLSPNPDLLFFITECFTLGILLYGPAILFGERLRHVYLFLVSVIVSLVFVSQYVYFSFFGGFLQASALKYAGQLGDEKSTIFTLLSPALLLFLLNVITVVFAGSVSYKKRYRTVSLSRRRRVVASLGILSVALFGYGLILLTGEQGWQKITHPMRTLHDLNSFTYAPNHLIQRVGVCNYYFGDLIGVLLRDTSLSEADKLFAQNWFTEKTIDMPGRYFGAAKDRNLIIVQFESLESSVMGQKIDGQEITPHLNTLSREGLYFDNYYAQVGPGNTADAEFVTLNSLYPLTNTVAFIDFAHNKYKALPSLLEEYDYHTYVLHGDVPAFWNRANIYPGLGYGMTISKNDFIEHEVGFETLNDDDFFMQSAEKMRVFPQPFMATLITLSSHSPFVIPEEYQTLQMSSDLTLSRMQKNYLQSVHYADNSLGQFIDALKKTGLYDRSLIVIYGDHGSMTGISSQIGTTTNHTLSSLRTSQVPLIILAPRSPLQMIKKIHTPGSHLDLYPTIANLLGIEPPQTIFGQDMLSTKTPIATRRDPYSRIITTILTPTIAYEGVDSGVFEEGSCLQMPTKKTLPVMDCKKVYENQYATIEASDFVVRGDLVSRIIFPKLFEEL